MSGCKQSFKWACPSSVAVTSSAVAILEAGCLHSNAHASCHVNYIRINCDN